MYDKASSKKVPVADYGNFTYHQVGYSAYIVWILYLVHCWPFQFPLFSPQNIQILCIPKWGKSYKRITSSLYITD